MWLSFSKQPSLCKRFMIERCNQLRGFPGIPAWSQFLDSNISPLPHFFFFLLKLIKCYYGKKPIGWENEENTNRTEGLSQYRLLWKAHCSMEPSQSFTAWGFVKTVETASFSTRPSGLNREELIAWKWADFAFILPRTLESCSPDFFFFEKLPFSPHLSQPFMFLIFQEF